MLTLAGLSLRAEPTQPAPNFRMARVPSDARLAADALFKGTVRRPCFRSRTGVQYLVCRNWRASSKKADLEAFKDFKLGLPPEGVSVMAAEMVELLVELYGPNAFRGVVPIACGHSRRPDCLSWQLALQIAAGIGGELVEAFAPRFLEGVSHPKEFRDLPPLELQREVVGPVLVVDDAATSGWHMHEALTRLRDLGVACLGLVYLSGTVQSGMSGSSPQAAEPAA